MSFLSVLSSMMNFEMNLSGFYIALVILSLVFISELLCIVFLIGKMLRAKKNRIAERKKQEETRDYAFSLFLLSVLPLQAEWILSGLSIACGVGAVLLVILICVFRLQGYDYPSDLWVREERQRREDEERLEEIEKSEAVRRKEDEEVFTLSLPDEEPSEKNEENNPPKKAGKNVFEKFRKQLEEAKPAQESEEDSAEDTEKDALSVFDEPKRKTFAPPIGMSFSKDDDDDDDDASDDDDEGEAEPDNEPEATGFCGNERIIGFDENTGCYIVAHYRKSFMGKLIQARPHIKRYYSELKNALLSYKGSKSRISWSSDSFHNGRTQIAKINVKTRILEIYFALDPKSLEGTVYRGKDMGNLKKYADTPFQYKVRTQRKFDWAMELVERTYAQFDFKKIENEHVDYAAEVPFESIESLVERGVVKEYIRQEKPATSFEFSEEHKPELPAEDGSVIPTESNFTWEMDNEKPFEEETIDTASNEDGETDIAEEQDRNDEASAAKPTDERTEPSCESAFVPAPPKEETQPEPILSGFETVAEESAENDVYFGDDVEEVEEAPKQIEEAKPAFAWENNSDVIAEQIEEVRDETFDDLELDAKLIFAGEDDTEQVPTSPDVEEDYPEEEPVEEPAEELERESAEEERPIEEPPKKKAKDPTIAVIDVVTLEKYFPTGSKITLNLLKQAGLVLPSAQTLSVFASGSIQKRFVVEANRFTLDAIQAIDRAGGDLLMLY